MIKLAAALVVIALAASLLAFGSLPETMPVHWNVRGEADGWMAREYAAFMMPAMIVLSAALFSVLPAISPKGFEIDGATRTYRRICGALLVFMLATHLLMLGAALGYGDVGRTIPVLVGALFVVLGNYVTKMPRNFFIGIRTPWTLADQDVWFRTHRFGGRVFVAAGLAIAIAGLVLSGPALAPVFVGIVVATIASTVGYSYLTWRRNRETPTPTEG